MSITLDLPEELSVALKRRATEAGQTPEQFASDALRRQLAIQRFRETQAQLIPQAEAAGLSNEDDILNAIS